MILTEGFQIIEIFNHRRWSRSSSVSIQCLATGWTTERSRFDPRQKRKDFSCSLCVQDGSVAHPASCTMGTGGPFPGGKMRPGRDADHSPHLVSRSWMSRSYTSSPPSACMAYSGTALLVIEAFSDFVVLRFLIVLLRLRITSHCCLV
jgi:hypothetical protein